MYSLKEQNGMRKLTSAKPILAAKYHRQFYPFFFHMGPVTLCITSVLLIGLMAVLYLGQLGQGVGVNQQLQDLRTQQATLQRENQDLVNNIAQKRSPSYIAEQAKKQGLEPSDPKAVQIVVIPHLQTIPHEEEEPLAP